MANRMLAFEAVYPQMLRWLDRFSHPLCSVQPEFPFLPGMFNYDNEKSEFDQLESQNEQVASMQKG